MCKHVNESFLMIQLQGIPPHVPFPARRCPDGKIRLFSKGADTMIMARLRDHQAITPSVRRHLVRAGKKEEQGLGLGVK